MISRILRSTAMMLIATVAVGGMAVPARATDRDGAGAPPRAVSNVMRLAQNTSAPAGFLDFCRRSPEQCLQSGPAGVTETPANVRQRATRLYWADVFGGRQADSPASLGRGDARMRSQGYDWSRAFPARAPKTDVSVPAQPTVAVPARRVLNWGAGTAIASLTLAAPSDDPERRPVRPFEQVARSLGATTDKRPFFLTEPLAAMADAGGAKPFAAAAHSAVSPMPVIAIDNAWTTPEPPPPASSTGTATEAAVVALSPHDWARVNAVNHRINRQIRRGSDADVFGVADFWQPSTVPGARGDCEDYVLTKRQALIEAGIPPRALSIAIVRTRRGESHAVLLLATPEAEYVLDNLSPWISPWNEVDYEWRERQLPGRVFDWVRLAA